MSNSERSRLTFVMGPPHARQLTEAFALVLEVQPTLVQPLLSHWLEPWSCFDDPSGARLRVCTEANAGSAGFIDLEIRAPAAYRIWIEVKRNEGGESGDSQLQKYATKLAEVVKSTGESAALIYLTRPGLKPPDVVEGVRFEHRTWADLGEWLRCRNDLCVLAVEFKEFLEEDGLSAGPITSDDLELLPRLAPARNRLISLFDLVAERIQKGVGLEEDARCPKRQPQRVGSWDWWYQTFRPPRDWPAGLVFEWNFRQREHGTGNTWSLAAGLTVQLADTSLGDDERFLERARQQRFELLWEEGLERLYHPSWKLAEAVEELESLESQVEWFESKVTAVFDALRRIDPPRLDD